jgi:PAS domain S-box-containing protein
VTPPRILVVDDDDSGRYASSRILRRAGYQVMEAGTGSEALRRAAAECPDLVLLDVRLPDMSGLEVAARLKSSPQTGGVLILQMSASGVDGPARVNALEAGADGYLTSPVEPEVLVATVRALLRIQTAEAALAESARDWQATFDAIGDGVALLDAEGVVRRCNTAFPMALGLAPDQVAGRSVDDLLPSLGETSAIAAALEKRGRTSWEIRANNRDFAVHVDPMAGPEGRARGAVAIFADVTDHKEFERKLRYSQKLESLGLLAGGVAHDFNNLLMGILGNASMALETLPGAPTETREALEDVVRASERAADLTRQLLAYSGKGRFVIEPIDLTTVVREMVPLIRSSIPRKVTFAFDLADDLPATEADRGQIEQVVMNLIINAAEAIQDAAGTVTVTTSLRRVSESERNEFKADHELSGLFLALSVRDTGIGMDAETLHRIFDPFFSTKFLGRGLGLSATLGIVRGHKGGIRVRSKPGRGTSFDLLFPASDAAVPVPIAAGPDQPACVAPGRYTILVVDDEESIRRLMKAVLERRGYEVLLAADGREALTLFALHSLRISLVVLDLVMPVMSGNEVLPLLLAGRSGLPVIVSSGQDAAEGMRRLDEPRVAAYIQKPYRAAELARKVHAVLFAQAGQPCGR